MIVEFDHLEGRDVVVGVTGLTIMHMGIFSNEQQIAEFTLHNGTLALKDMRGRLLGSLSVQA